MGTGDAELPYRLARVQPQRLFVGLDANADGMLATARRASRKPARGGVDNLVLVQARIEELPPELHGIADTVTIYFPWAGLLHALVGSNAAGLAGIAALCRPAASVEAVFSHDARDGADSAVPVLSHDMIRDEVAAHWRAAGLAIDELESLTIERVRALSTSWAKRLGFGAPRAVWRLSGRRIG